MVTLSSFVPLQYLPQLWKRDRQRWSAIEPVPAGTSEDDLSTPVPSRPELPSQTGVQRAEVLLLLSMPIPIAFGGMDFSMILEDREYP